MYTEHLCIKMENTDVVEKSFLSTSHISGINSSSFNQLLNTKFL